MHYKVTSVNRGKVGTSKVHTERPTIYNPKEEHNHTTITLLNLRSSLKPMGNAFQSHEKIQLKLICNQPSERERCIACLVPPGETSKIRSENLPNCDEIDPSCSDSSSVCDWL